MSPGRRWLAAAASSLHDHDAMRPGTRASARSVLRIGCAAQPLRTERHSPRRPKNRPTNDSDHPAPPTPPPHETQRLGQASGRLGRPAAEAGTAGFRVGLVDDPATGPRGPAGRHEVEDPGGDGFGQGMVLSSSDGTICLPLLFIAPNANQGRCSGPSWSVSKPAWTPSVLPCPGQDSDRKYTAPRTARCLPHQRGGRRAARAGLGWSAGADALTYKGRSVRGPLQPVR